MDITCPHCHQTLEGDGSLAGETVICPGCNKTFTVPKLVVRKAPEMSSKHDETTTDKEPDYYDMWKSPLGWICVIGGTIVGFIIVPPIAPIIAFGLYSWLIKKKKR